MQLPISLVIPTMNRPESLDRTLKLIFNSISTPNQVIIVDQSSDPTIMVKNQRILQKYNDQLAYPVFEHQGIPSLTKARNRGLDNVQNDIIVFSDDDVDVNSDTIMNVYNVMQDHNIAMIAGIDEFSQKPSTNIGYLLGTKSFRKRNIGHVTRSMLGRYPNKIVKQTETQWAQGYFFAVRKNLMAKWNCRWDENLTSYAYAEDLDFSFGYYKHAHSEGLKCVIDPTIKVKHLATKEYRIPNAQNVYMYVINRAYLSHKHNMGAIGMIASAWCNFWRLVQSIISNQNPKAFLHAMWCTVKYRNDIYEGHLDYKKFME